MPLKSQHGQPQPLPIRAGLYHTRAWWRQQSVNSEARDKNNTLAFYPGPLNLLLWGEAERHIVRTLKQPRGLAHLGKN